MLWIGSCGPLLALRVLGFLVDFIKAYFFGKAELHQEAAGPSRGANKTISSKQTTVKGCFNFLSEEVQPKLAAIHEKHEEEFCRTHTRKQWELGDRVWVRNLPKHEDRHFDKLARIWSGPYEILEIMGGGRYCVATSQGPQIMQIGHLKLAPPLLLGVKLKCDHHTLCASLEHYDTWVVEDMVDFKEVPSTWCKGKVQKWLVKWKGHQTWTWETRDQFLHHVCDPWRACNAEHGIRVPL